MTVLTNNRHLVVMDLIVCTKKCNLYIVSPIHTVNNFVLSFIYNYSENSSKYEYKYEYTVASTSTSTSTQPSSTSTSTSTWNLYSSTSTSTKYYISGHACVMQ